MYELENIAIFILKLIFLHVSVFIFLLVLIDLCMELYMFTHPNGFFILLSLFTCFVIVVAPNAI